MPFISLDRPNRTSAVVEIALSRVTSLPAFRKTAANTAFRRATDFTSVKLLNDKFKDNRKASASVDQITIGTNSLLEIPRETLRTPRNILTVSHETVHIAQNLRGDDFRETYNPLYDEDVSEQEAVSLEQPVTDFVNSILATNEDILSLDSPVARASQLLKILKERKEAIETSPNERETIDSQISSLEERISNLQNNITIIENRELDDSDDSGPDSDGDT